MINKSAFLETAVEAARLGASILKDRMARPDAFEVSHKQTFDFVTQVDLQSEEAIIAYISERHPGHRILAEESGEQSSASVYQWIIDPLDGTKNYIHGFPFFAVSIALGKGDTVIVAAVIDPVRDELFYAEKGKGAFLNDERISVSSTSAFSECLLATGFPFRAKHLVEPYFAAFISLFHVVSDQRRAGAAALDLAYVACGRLDGFWEIGLNLWDIAGGALLITEAGGTVTDIYGNTGQWHTGNIVGSNGSIHDLITAKLKSSFKKVKLP